MVWTICKKELRLNFLNLRIPLMLIFAVSFASIASVISCSHFLKQVDEYNTRQIYLKADKWTFNVDRPPNTLSIFCNGVFLKSPISVEVPKFPYFGFETKKAEHPTDKILLSRVQYPDISFVIAVVAGLGAILFAFDSICGEKEKGTLKLALSNDIPRHKLLMGKFMGSATGLLAIVLLIWLVSIAIVISEPSINLAAKDFAFLGLSCLASFGYVVLFVAITLLISSVVSSSIVSLVMAVTFWMLISLLMPPLGSIMAKRIRKTPDYQQFVNQRHSLLSAEAEKTYKESENRLKDIKTQEEGSKLMAEVLEPHSVSWFKLNEQLISEFDNKLARQIDLSRFICSISPALAFQFALSEVCGTFIGSQRLFEQQASDWGRTCAENSTRQGWFMIVAGKQPLEVTQLVIKNLSAKRRLKNCLGYLSYMAILSMFCFAVTFVRFVRYDVR